VFFRLREAERDGLTLNKMRDTTFSLSKLLKMVF
jgi:hypothetical protein